MQLLDILRHAVDSAVFQIGPHVVRQVRGACIGSPLSPPWRALNVMQREF